MKRICLILLATMMMLFASTQAYCQKIQTNSGKCYKFRLTKKQMRDAIRGEQTHNQRQACLRNLVGVYDIDSFPVNDSTLGQWAWVKQDANNIIVRYFNNPLFKVEVYGDALTGGVVRKNRVFVAIVPDSAMKCDIRKAKVRIRSLDRLFEYSLWSKLKWSERDGGFVGNVSTNRNEFEVEVELDGYIDRTNLIFQSYHRRWTARRRSTWQPEMSWGVTDKYMYKPDETVKWKFVMTDKKGKPCKGKAVVILNHDTVYSGNVDKQGAIYGETMLADSFNLKSGSSFCLLAKVGKYENRLYCTYKDYELKSLTVTADVEKYEVVHGDTIKVKVKAADERGKPVMQGKVYGSWMVGYVNGIEGDMVQFSKEGTPLDTLEIRNGEAVLEIPTAEMPAADFRVEVVWKMRTAEGEEESGLEYVTCEYPSAEQRGTEVSSSEELKDTEKQYFITCRNLADSVEFWFDGYGEMFNWVVLRNGKEMASGRDTLLDWKTKEAGMSDYTCVVVKDGKTWNKTINHSSDMLKVTVEQKNKINPGEEDEITVRVTDSKGRPVADADITALAATSKLGYNIDSPRLKVKSKYRCDDIATYEQKYLYDYVLLDKQLTELIEADKNQYWKLMNAKDSIVVVETPSSVGSQIVPVLVRNGMCVPVTRVMINDKTYVPMTSNRYVAAPRLGKNYVCFCTGDTLYIAYPEINDTLPLKRWFGIPAECCKKIACSMEKEALIIPQMLSMVKDIEGRGMPFLLRDGEIIPLSSDVSSAVVGNGVVAVGAVNIDSMVNRENIVIGSDRTVSIWHEPTVMQYESFIREKIDMGVKISDVSLDDSLCTIEELRQEWIKKLDEMRGNELDRGALSYVKRGCEVRLVQNEGERHPVQVCYREKGSAEWITIPLWYEIMKLETVDPSAELRGTGASSEGREYEILFMYEGGVTRLVNVQTSEKNQICVRSSCRDGEGVVDKKLEYEMRKRMEEKCEKKSKKYSSAIGMEYIVSGWVFYENGEPAVGGLVQVEGTLVGTVVDVNGRFTINVPIGKRVLVFSMIGMQTVSAVARNGMTVTMKEDNEAIEEVMAVSYGASRKKSIPYAMAGEVAGVQVVDADGMPGTNSSVRIRGIGSVNSSTEPLYVVNGVPFDGDILSLDPSLIASTTVLKDGTATSLYGSRGANGVILITTAGGGQTMDASLPYEIDMRENFNDVAFFVPDCRTDKEGRAVVKVKYPDDLTSWSEWFVAVKGKQRGVARSIVKAEKQHEAKLNMPRFAVEGDSVGAVGIGVDRTNGEFVSDTLHSVAEGDSLCMQFSYKTDGEKRCVKVYPQGLKMIEGSYHLMDSDATVTLAYKPEYGEMKVGVFGDAREMMMASVERVAEQDWCGSNDFMANRLRALRMLPETEERSREIKKIENTLRKNRGENGMWCWWGKPSAELKGTVADLWVTERVLEALGVSENETVLEAELALRREKYRGKWNLLLEVATLYRVMGHEETAKEIAMTIPDDSIKSTALRIDKQMIEGREVRFDTMRHTTYTDGSYYSFRDGNSPWWCVTCEEVSTSLQAYRYFLDKNDKEECKNIKRWLLQYAFKGFLSEWMEMQIIRTLWNGQPVEMKDVLYQISVGGKALEGLPYHTAVSSEIEVEYKGRRDVYISTEQNWWNKAPMAQGNGMSIYTLYNSGVITVDVTVEKTAENVIVSVPIPAGCSYADDQSWSNSEMYREEYRDRVNIYCYQLREGRHTFKISLNERYPGVYTINPAQVRLVDYPVFNANNELKKVEIK